ncbi:MAG TPA: hypothetical protein VLB84_10560, partial [Bacteroidia bacterium]|nr:hypothetical protein [Bacteroidia bacterium]
MQNVPHDELPVRTDVRAIHGRRRLLLLLPGNCGGRGGRRVGRDCRMMTASPGAAAPGLAVIIRQSLPTRLPPLPPQ